MDDTSTDAKILVVDDSPLNVEMLDGILAAHGYRIVTARSGLEALDVVAREAPDVVLLDVLMPDLDGYEVCQRLRADPATRLLPIILITASGEQQKVHAIEAGADDFITKPLNRAELLARLRGLVRMKGYQDTIQAQTRELAEWNRTLQERVEQQVHELERLQHLRRFLSPQIADLVVADNAEDFLQSHRQEIAVLCSELRGFGALTETSEPETVLAVVREFHSVVGQLVFRFEGTLAHLSGDGLTVFFNDPVPCSNPAESAIRLALAMRSEVQQLQQTWHVRGQQLGLATGIALGFASVGKIGFQDRFEYGAIGPVTVLAAHLGAQARSGQILVADRVYAATRDAIDAQSVGDTLPKEFLRPVAAYEVHDLRPPVAPLENYLASLSPRERHVAALVARGFSNHQVAQELVVTDSTAAKHIENIFSKLGFSSRAQLAAWAVRQGLAPDTD